MHSLLSIQLTCCRDSRLSWVAGWSRQDHHRHRHRSPVWRVRHWGIIFSVQIIVFPYHVLYDMNSLSLTRDCWLKQSSISATKGNKSLSLCNWWSSLMLCFYSKFSDTCLIQNSLLGWHLHFYSVVTIWELNWWQSPLWCVK